MVWPTLGSRTAEEQSVLSLSVSQLRDMLGGFNWFNAGRDIVKYIGKPDVPSRMD